MNLAETAKILTLCAAFDQRTIGETDVAAWQETLEHLPFDACKSAVKRWYREHRERIMPADVVALVRAQLPHPSDVMIAAPANPVPMPRELFRVPTPRDDKPVDPTALKHREAMRHECKFCNARPGQRCTVMGKDRATPHPLRGKPEQVEPASAS